MILSRSPGFFLSWGALSDCSDFVLSSSAWASISEAGVGPLSPFAPSPFEGLEWAGDVASIVPKDQCSAPLWLTLPPFVHSSPGLFPRQVQKLLHRLPRQQDQWQELRRPVLFLCQALTLGHCQWSSPTLRLTRIPRHRAEHPSISGTSACPP